MRAWALVLLVACGGGESGDPLPASGRFAATWGGVTGEGCADYDPPVPVSIGYFELPETTAGVASVLDGATAEVVATDLSVMLFPDGELHIGAWRVGPFAISSVRCGYRPGVDPPSTESYVCAVGWNHGAAQNCMGAVALQR